LRTGSDSSNIHIAPKLQAACAYNAVPAPPPVTASDESPASSLAPGELCRHQLPGFFNVANASKDVLPSTTTVSGSSKASALLLPSPTSISQPASSKQLGLTENDADKSLECDLDNDLGNEPAAESQSSVPTSFGGRGGWAPESIWFNDAVMSVFSGSVRSSGLKSMHPYMYPDGLARPFTPTHFNALFSAAAKCCMTPPGWVSFDYST
jgi:hypothetical protein